MKIQHQRLCHECYKNRELNALHVKESQTTRADVHTFREHEKYHVHDPNITTTTYVCHKGHVVVDVHVRQCLTCDWTLDDAHTR